jgi:hypothetical protein
VFLFWGSPPEVALGRIQKISGVADRYCAKENTTSNTDLNHHPTQWPLSSEKENQSVGAHSTLSQTIGKLIDCYQAAVAEPEPVAKKAKATKATPKAEKRKGW